MKRLAMIAAVVFFAMFEIAYAEDFDPCEGSNDLTQITYCRQMQSIQNEIMEAHVGVVALAKMVINKEVSESFFNSKKKELKTDLLKGEKAVNTLILDAQKHYGTLPKWLDGRWIIIMGTNTDVIERMYERELGQDFLK